MRNFALAVVCLVLGACATIQAPVYQPSAENQLELHNGAAAQASVGTVDAGSAKVNKLTLRGNTFVPSAPIKTFNDYLAQAIRTELQQANMLDNNDHVVIGGTLFRNDIDGASMSVGTASLAADFWVKRDGKTVYQGHKTATYQWKSSFAGMTAIPKAAEGYMHAVQNLVHALLVDPDFRSAIKKEGN